MLSRFADHLGDLLLPLRDYRPFPPACDRPAWEALPAQLRQEQVARGEQALGHSWAPLPATLFMEFSRTGNRSHYERASFERRTALAALVVAECCQGAGRFCDDIANGGWAICEESFWGVPAHYEPGRPREMLPTVERPIIDLFAGETAGLLAWTDYLVGDSLDRVSPVLRRRLQAEMRRRILDPFLERTDFWWMGLDYDRPVNNWNPWCTSNCLAAALLLERRPARRRQAVAKALLILDRFLGGYHPDGGCDEGTSYWNRAGGSLFDCLEQLYWASGGKINLYSEPLVAEIGRFLCRAHIAGDWYVNFADGGARLRIPANLVFRYGRRIGDTGLAGLGAGAWREHSREEMVAADPLLRRLPALFGQAELAAATEGPPYLRDVWLDGIQVMAAREHAGTPAGLYLAAKGGHNGESHNHNDVGQFLVYLDGEPVLVDAGVETYTARTFGPERYQIWTMQSAYHNLPTVDGLGQQEGEQFRASQVAYQASDTRAELSLELAAAYPPQAGLASWQRTLALERGADPQVTVSDRWQLRRDPSELALNLITPHQPAPLAPGQVRLGRARLEYPAELDLQVEPLPLSDPRLQSVWGEHLFRLRFLARVPARTGAWTLRLRPQP